MALVRCDKGTSASNLLQWRQKIYALLLYTLDWPQRNWNAVTDGRSPSSGPQARRLSHPPPHTPTTQQHTAFLRYFMYVYSNTQMVLHLNRITVVIRQLITYFSYVNTGGLKSWISHNMKTKLCPLTTRGHFNYVWFVCGHFDYFLPKETHTLWKL